MGKLIYSNTVHVAEIEDRTLMHLRVVVMNKLRRGEPFMLNLPPDQFNPSRRDLWMHPALSLQLHFSGSRTPQINPRWIEALMESANGPDGMSIVPEPHV